MKSDDITNNNMYKVSVNNDHLNLICEGDRKSQIAVKTPFRIMERVDLNKVVAQGKINSPLKCLMWRTPLPWSNWIGGMCWKQKKERKSQAASLLHSIVDEEYIYNINMLQVVLTPTTSHSDYLQGRNVDTRKAHENVQLVAKTHQNLRNDESFEEVMSKSNSQVIIKPKQSDK